MVNRIPEAMHGNWSTSLWPKATVTYSRNSYRFMAPNGYKFDVVLGKVHSRLGTWYGYQEVSKDFVWIYGNFGKKLILKTSINFLNSNQ